MKLEIVTPEKLLFSQDVGLAVLPGACGEFGVLDNHSPLIAELQQGEIKVYANQNGGEPIQQFIITGGVAQVTSNTCTVLATSVAEAA